MKSLGFFILSGLLFSACSTNSVTDGMAKYNNVVFGVPMDKPATSEQNERFFKLLREEGPTPAMDYWRKVSKDMNPNRLFLESDIDGSSRRLNVGEVQDRVTKNNANFELLQTCKSFASFEEQFYCLKEGEKAPGKPTWVYKKGEDQYNQLLAEVSGKMDSLVKERATVCKKKNFGDVFMVRVGVTVNLGDGYYKAQIVDQKELCKAPRPAFLYHDQIIKTSVEMPRYSCQGNAILVYGGKEKFKSRDGFTEEASVWKIIEGKEAAGYAGLKTPKAVLQENCLTR